MAPVVSQIVAQQTADIPDDQKREFLLTAEVIGARRASKGVTSPWRLTLSNGTVTHDALFQPIDEQRESVRMESGRTEHGFKDSYHYNIAAYEIGRLLGLDVMMPLTVERKWNGMTGSLSWWLKVKMDEGERMKQKIEPPDKGAWNRQMFRQLVFAELIYDTDRNATNTLIGPEWQMYMIDFTRAFRTLGDLRSEKSLGRCDRQLFEKLKALTAEQVKQAAGKHLTGMEVQGVMRRRDKIVAHFEGAAAKGGDAAIFY
jgi:hypothetical protein